jgi:hypothetical protein
MAWDSQWAQLGSAWRAQTSWRATSRRDVALPVAPMRILRFTVRFVGSTMVRRVRQRCRPQSETCPRTMRRRAVSRCILSFAAAYLTGGMATVSDHPNVPREHLATRSHADARVSPALMVGATAPEPGAPASPARLANLTSAVIFADANTISYRKPTPDGALMQARAAADRWFGPRRPAEPSPLARTAAVDACPADDPDTRSGHESTITMFFAPDSGTAHVMGEYVLWRQANDSAPIVLVRHVLRDGHRPFLAYKYAVATGSGVDSLAAVPRDVLPISRADTTTGSDVDVRALRDVEWRFLVILDTTSHPEHIARVHIVTSLPAIDRLDRHECRERGRVRPRLTRG